MRPHNYRCQYLTHHTKPCNCKPPNTPHPCCTWHTTTCGNEDWCCEECPTAKERQ